MEHLQSIFSYSPEIKSLPSVPKDQFFNKFCGATAALLHHLLFEVSQETEWILEALNKKLLNTKSRA